MSAVTCSASSETSDTKAKCVETSQARRFLDVVSKLPRPQVMVEDAQFLTYYSLQAQQLTLTDILSESASSNKESLEEFPCVYPDSSVLVQKISSLDPATPIPKVHLSTNVLSGKQKQLQALVQLYDSEIQWLSRGSKLWFGQLREKRVSLLIDFSDAVCFSENYNNYISALQQLFSEQLTSCDKVQVTIIGSDVIHLDLSMVCCSTSFIKKWFTELRSQGSCNLLKGLKVALKCSDIDMICIILCSRPNQNTDVIYDYLTQTMAGKEKPYFHTVAINLDKDVQDFLCNIASEFKGHYHQLNLNDGNPLMEDSLINEIQNEMNSAEKVIEEIEHIKSGSIERPLIDALRQLSVVSQWPRDDTFAPSSSSAHLQPYSLSCSSEQWLRRYGIDSLGLDLYEFLAPDAYSRLSEYVALIDKTTFSTVYDIMPKFIWNDGSQKYLHVDVRRMEEYMADLKVYSQLLQQRLAWLQSGSKIPFGSVHEERVVIIVDCSLRVSLYLLDLQQRLKIFLHEQISQTKLFNIIRFGEFNSQWREIMAAPTRENLADAWRWILDINPSGTCNLLGCLKYCMENGIISKNCTSNQPLGVYLIISNIPDQDTVMLCSYIEQTLIDAGVNLHIVFYQPTHPNPTIESSLMKGVGKYGNEADVLRCVKQLAESGSGSLHHFSAGEFHGSNDHTLLTRELSRAQDYSDTIQQILENYREHCKRNVPLEDKSCKEEKHSIKQVPPVNPRPTLTSVVRMNCNASKLKELQQLEYPNVKINKSSNEKFIKCQCFYTGKGLRKGIHLELVETPSTCTYCKKPLIPSKEEQISSADWLSKYSLQSFDLYNNKMFTPCSNGFKHVTADGQVIELSLSHQQLNKKMQQIKSVRQRYTARLQWLLSDSRLVFGCIHEKKIVIMIDVSASMSVHFLELKEQLMALIDEQILGKKCSFNVLAYSTKVSHWKSNLVPSTEDNRTEAQKWIGSLSTGGSSCLLEAINISLRQKPSAIYLITDGETDHSYKYILSQIAVLSSSHVWRMNTISYHTSKRESVDFLKILAQKTEGRFHHYPVLEGISSSLMNGDHKTNQFELGDDLKLLISEIQIVDTIVHKLLYHLGRTQYTV